MNLNGPPYRVVTFRDQIGMTVSEPAMVPMAACSTGDFFQGFLVTNDLADETAIRWSLATNPEVQPKPYVMRFNSKRKDTITLVKSLGSVLIVGLRDSIKRVNYLPTEIDTDFSQGIAHEDLAVDHGIAGPLAACRFDMPGQGTVLAYASSAGMFLTNGISVRPLSGDLDWSNTVKLSALSSSVLRVYPKEKWLAFYYCPAGASHNRNTRVLYFTYQSDKIKNGSLPAIGPCKVSARSVAEASLNGDTYLITGHEHDGKIYVEDSGLTIPTGYQARNLSDAAEDVKIVPRIRTRKMYPAGIARDAREEKLYLLYSKYGSTVAVTGCTTTGGSTTVAKNGLDAAVKIGMKVTGDSIQPGTIVTDRAANSFTMSLPAYSDTAGGGKSLTFDSGTLAVSVRGSGVAEDPSKFDTQYVSTRIGDLLVAHNDNARQGIELEIQKVPITYDADGNATLTADLSTNMRIHQFTWMLGDTGNEQNRSTI
jgi:hypothetical protein